MGIYHWEISRLDMIKTTTTQNEDLSTATQPYVSIKCIFCVWTLDGSQWKDDTNNPKLVEGSMGMDHWEIYCLDMVK